MRVAAVIPAYQAANTVGDVAQRTLALLPLVLVVDDGSTDRTGDVARAAGAKLAVHKRNLGKGRALKTGFAQLLASGVDGVVTLDADGQHLPEQIPLLLAKAAEGADLVLGVRDHLFHEMSPLRRASNRISSGLISLAAGEHFADIQTGFRFYSRSLIEEVGIREPRFDAESAVLVRAVRRGYSVLVTPVELGFADGRGTSHYRTVVDSLRIARAVVRARFEPHR